MRRRIIRKIDEYIYCSTILLFSGRGMDRQDVIGWKNFFYQSVTKGIIIGTLIFIYPQTE